MRFGIYALHLVFWSPYLVRGALQQARGRNDPGPAVRAAPGARAMLAYHCVALGVVYWGLGAAVIPDRVPALFAGQREASAVVALLGTALSTWTLLTFRSWRLRAELAAGHELSTDGPFQFVRHPIYTSVSLLGLASWLWCPTPTVAVGAVLNHVASEVRARAEEKLLVAHFSERYTDYMRRVKRFVPFVY